MVSHNLASENSCPPWPVLRYGIHKQSKQKEVPIIQSQLPLTNASLFLQEFSSPAQIQSNIMYNIMAQVITDSSEKYQL